VQELVETALTVERMDWLMGADFVGEAEPAAFLLQLKNDAAAELLELRKR
jgi:hypothetical protein